MATDGLSLKSLKKAFSALGFIEFHGYSEENRSKISRNDVMAFIDQLWLDSGHDSQDHRRQISNMKEVFEEFFLSHTLQGDRSGYKILANSDGSEWPESFKTEPGYAVLCMALIALLEKEQFLHIDMLDQLFFQNAPVGFLTEACLAIRNNHPVSFSYTNRSKQHAKIENLVPVKIAFRRGHWTLIGANEAGTVIQYMIHSIENLTVNTEVRRPVSEFNTNDFFADSFEHAVLENHPVHSIEILVPEELVNAVQKRRTEGSWKLIANDWLWTVHTFDPNEVFAYLTRWQGALKLKGPAEIIEQYREYLQKNLNSIT